MRIVQLSDIHLLAEREGQVRGQHPDWHAQVVLGKVPEYAPDHIVVVGDVSDDGSEASYERAKHYLDRCGIPWSWLPGNHDVEPPMSTFAPMAAAVDLGSVELLQLDSHINEAGHEEGHLGEDQLQWLDERLRVTTRPVIVALHHPPLLLPSRWMNDIALDDRDSLWEILEDYPHVRGVLAGHIHYPLDEDYNGVRVLTAPAVIDQFTPGSDVFDVDKEALPGFRVIDISDTTGEIEHTDVVRVAIPERTSLDYVPVVNAHDDGDVAVHEAQHDA